jgi:predicted nucleic acid-binding protein
METRFDSTLDTAMKFSLSFYDAAYLDLAIQDRRFIAMAWRT